MGRQHVRDAWPDEKLPPTASWFGGIPNKRSVSLMGPAAQKRLLKEALGVEKVSANGLEIFSSLLDNGVNEALKVAREIHDAAVAQGASKKTFGTDKHVLVARDHPMVRTAPRVDERVARVRMDLANEARARMNAMDPKKREKRINYQYVPSYVKTLFNRLNKIKKMSHHGKLQVSMSVKDALFETMNVGGAMSTNLVRTSLGEMTVLGINNMHPTTVFFAENGKRTFFPAHQLLIGASQAKWMSYETVATLMLICRNAEGVSRLFKLVLAREETHTDLAGFYKQFKAVSKDALALANAQPLPNEAALKMQRAAVKAASVDVLVPGRDANEKLYYLANNPVVVLDETYFGYVADGFNKINTANPRNIVADIQNPLATIARAALSIEEWFHGGGSFAR